MLMKFGAIVVDGRGKIGGHVASKNRGGAYLRTKVTPVNPQTADQSAFRTMFGSLAQLYRTLTAEQVATWNSSVDLWKKTNIFGDLKIPSGLNLFVRLNQGMLIGGQPANLFCPPPVEIVSPLNPTIAYNATTGIYSFTCDNIGDLTGTLVFTACEPLTPSVSYVANKMRQVYLGINGTFVAADYKAAYAAKFGVQPAVGQKVIVGVKVLDISNGQMSPVTTMELTITAP